MRRREIRHSKHYTFLLVMVMVMVVMMMMMLLLLLLLLLLPEFAEDLFFIPASFHDKAAAGASSA